MKFVNPLPVNRLIFVKMYKVNMSTISSPEPPARPKVRVETVYPCNGLEKDEITRVTVVRL